MHETTVTLGLLGCGNVGAALCRLLERDGDAIAARTGVRLRLGRVAVRSLPTHEPDIAACGSRLVVMNDGSVVKDAAQASARCV
mgnify:CR=1 FL=1